MRVADQLDAARSPAEVYGALDAPVQALVQAVAGLYGGSWDDCAEDLRRRQAGRPYLFKLAPSLDPAAAIAWLAHLKAYEAARGETFAAAIPLENR